MAANSAQQYGPFPDGAATHNYAHYFSQRRAEAPQDTTISREITKHQSTRPPGQRTTTITGFDPAGLSTVFSNGVVLDRDFVKAALDAYGPIYNPIDGRDWAFDANPNSVPHSVDSEQGFYAWYMWLIATPVAHACNAVCHHLHLRGANIDIRGIMRADVVHRTTGGGAADIVQRWYHSNTQQFLLPTCTLYEFKRDKVMRVRDENTLAQLVAWSHTSGGYSFRSGSGEYSSHKGKLYNLICQIIDEMIQGRNGHVILTTQTHYILVRLTPSLQLEISQLYSIHHSTTQADDMVILVLFCTLAALERVTNYPPAPIIQRVHIPRFPTWVFGPSQGVFWDGARQEQTKFCKPRKPSFLPLPWLGLEGEVLSAANDVSVARGQLFFFFLAAHVIAKSARGVAATQRLEREFLAYSVLRAWQGVAIPRIFGMYTSTDEKTKILLMSDAGMTLEDFGDLEPAERHLLFTRLVRLHQGGVLHNDIEPRNITRSKKSGPLVIDFDEASFDHVCPGASCWELRRLAEALQLDPKAEIAALPVAIARPKYLTIAALIFTLWCMYYLFHL